MYAVLLENVDMQVQGLHALSSLGKFSKDELDKEGFTTIVLKGLKEHENVDDYVSGT